MRAVHAVPRMMSGYGCFRSLRRFRFRRHRPVRLATYDFDGVRRAGLVDEAGECIADLGGVQVIDLIAQAPVALPLPGPWQPLLPERLAPPVPVPPLFLGVGLNYRDHAAEQGRTLPDRPALFIKGPMAAAPPFGTISSHFPSLDYEGELGVVIGRPCHRVSEAEAMAHVAGYVVVNDVTVRALIRPDNLVMGKGGSGHGPFGPWLTLAEAVPDPQALTIKTMVNGGVRQHSSTANLHIGIAPLISWISQAMVLPTGTIVATGSPGGSGVGFDPPLWLRPGDEVGVSIEGLGHIHHRVVAA
jgi:2-keto-4-pentenoate hydratase/2-oxohepta-3-ene-1,7-dioic acid hydratase in catechol pathway